MGKVSEKVLELNSKLPANVKKETDRLIRGVYRFHSDSQRRGKDFVASRRKKIRI